MAKPFSYIFMYSRLILKTFAVALTVAPVSKIYSPNITALSHVSLFIQSTPKRTNSLYEKSSVNMYVIKTNILKKHLTNKMF